MREACGRPDPPRAGWTRAGIALAVGLVALLVYQSNDNHVRTGDTFPARVLPISIIEEGDLDFNEFRGVARGGRPLEEGYMFNRVGERVLSYYSIVPGLLNLPTHLIARQMGYDIRVEVQVLGRITAGVVAALSVFFMTFTLLSVCERTGVAVMFGALFAFGTTTWSVAATGLWQHGPSLMFLGAAFAGLCLKRRAGILIAGFMLGMAVWNRLPNAAYAAGVTVYLALYRPRELPWLIGGAVPPALAMFGYSWTHWGSIWALGEGHQVTLFSGPLLHNLAATLVSPNRGFFVFSPVFLLALPTLYHVLRTPRRWPLLFALSLGSLAILLAHSLWLFWWGGDQFGYRLLTEMVPVWILLLALAWERWISKSRAGIAVFATLATLSVYINFLGGVYYPSGWNATPVSVNDHPERAWDYRDTEIGRLHRIFLEGEQAGSVR